MTLVLPPCIAIFVSWLALGLLRRSGRLPVDVPNARSLHQLPIPRGGGIAIWAGMLAGSAWLAQPQPWLAPLLLLVGVSLWDDRRGTSVPLRLAVQLGAAIGWLWADRPVAWPDALLAVLAIAWMTNLYNFMDGSDGLAATMTVIGFGAYAVGAGHAGRPEALVIATVVAATIPFLVLNFPPARIMLGDVGAVPLGFLAAVFGIGGWRAGYWPAWFPVLVFLPFIADATLTLARRTLSGAKVWQAHRDHYYQRLVRMGLGHAGTLAVYSALMVGTATSAMAALMRAPHAGASVLGLWVAVLLLLYAGIGYHWNRGNKGLNESKC
jgi:UDP-N-acetylmuramyl pentapeptide phosphotransferase/UDP-N-acetylglucosamine-1-phosphate transferase